MLAVNRIPQEISQESVDLGELLCYNGPMSEKKGTSIWIPNDVAERADKIVAHLQNAPDQYGAVTRSSVIRAALDRLYQELGLAEEEEGPPEE